MTHHSETTLGRSHDPYQVASLCVLARQWTGVGLREDPCMTHSPMMACWLSEMFLEARRPSKPRRSPASESSYFSQTDGRCEWPSFESAQNKTRRAWEWGFQERKPKV